MKKWNRPLLICLALMALAVPCGATPFTFAQFIVGGQEFELFYDDIPQSQNRLLVNAPVIFFFQNLPGLPAELQGPQLGTLTVSAITNQTAVSTVGGNYVQSGYLGSFSIQRTAAYNGLTNLLSGVFGSLTNLAGPVGGNSATLVNSRPPVSEVVFSSDFVVFSPTLSQAFAFSLSSLNPSLVRLPNGYLAPFAAAGTGTFSADFTVPEPAAFALMGLGLLGFACLLKRAAARRR